MNIIDQTIAAEIQYRAGLDVIGGALEDSDAINAVQALILCRMAPGETMSVNDIWSRCYEATNPTYNARKLETHGYLARHRNGTDLRKVMVSLTPKGAALRSRVLAHVEQRVAA